MGTSSLAQLEEDLQFFREPKPLPRELMWEIDRVHMRNRLPIFASTKVPPNPNPNPNPSPKPHPHPTPNPKP